MIFVLTSCCITLAVNTDEHQTDTTSSVTTFDASFRVKDVASEPAPVAEELPPLKFDPRFCLQFGQRSVPGKCCCRGRRISDESVGENYSPMGDGALCDTRSGYCNTGEIIHQKTSVQSTREKRCFRCSPVGWNCRNNFDCCGSQVIKYFRNWPPPFNLYSYSLPQKFNTNLSHHMRYLCSAVVRFYALQNSTVYGDLRSL